jgi:glycosyltransferase involved in cell wall biosynthesis
MRVAFLTTDNREHYREYDVSLPFFGTAPEALLQGFARLPDLEVHIISCSQRALPSPVRLSENILYHNLHVPKLGWMRTAYTGCVLAVRRKLKELRPDIVHGQGTERDCAISAVFSGKPNVVTIHGNMAELARLFRAPVGSFGWLAARLETFTLRRTAGVFCNSEYTEGLVRNRARQVWRVPNPIREQFFERKRESLDASVGHPCRIVNVGLVSPRKRQLELLNVAQKLRGLGLRFQLCFVGHADRSTPYAQEFLDRIKPMEREGFATYLGPKTVAELIDCFDISNALLHFPSEEAFGLVVAEGLARNLKLFGARTGGIVDIAQGLPDADLFSIDDWPGVTSGLARWIAECRPTVGSAGVMRSRFHPDIIARRHVEIYREVLSNSS